MSRKNLSISQRLRKSKSDPVKLIVAQDWATTWKKEQKYLISALERAVKLDDYDALCITTGKLKAVTNKKFAGLPRVIALISAANHDINVKNDSK